MSFIYAISNGTNIKIGYSKNPIKRLKQLQTGCVDKLSIIHKIEVDDKKVKIVETLIHKKLSSYKISGEWYNISNKEAIDELNIAEILYVNNENLISIYKSGAINLLH